MKCCNAVITVQNGWQVYEVAKHHGGAQSVWFPNGDELPLEYDATKYKMFLQCQKPSPLEIKTILIQWIYCYIEDLQIDDGTKPIWHEPVQRTGQTIIDPSHQEKDPALISFTTTVDVPNSEEKSNKTLEYEKQ
eukprot:12960491-Ditylum_brightwellii.AAC.1